MNDLFFPLLLGITETLTNLLLLYQITRYTFKNQIKITNIAEVIINKIITYHKTQNHHITAW